MGTLSDHRLVRPLKDVPAGIRSIILVAGFAGVVMVVVASLESAGGGKVEVDKLLHFGGYFTLAALFVVGLPTKLYLLGLVGLLFLGTAIELIQPLTGRSMDWNDQIANSIGVAAGALAGFAIRHFLAWIRTELAAKQERLRTFACPMGKVVFQQGEESTDLYVVRRGRVRLTRDVAGKTIGLEVVGAGDVFGEMGVIRQEPRYATATAIEDCVLYRVDVDDLGRVCAGAGEAIPIVRALARRLVDADRRVDRLLGQASGGA